MKTKQKTPRVRISMKLLWKLYAQFPGNDHYKVQDFLNFVESSMKSPSKKEVSK